MKLILALRWASMCLPQRCRKQTERSKPSKDPLCLKERGTCMKTTSENDPIHHIQKIRAQLRQLVAHLRENV